MNCIVLWKQKGTASKNEEKGDVLQVKGIINADIQKPVSHKKKNAEQHKPPSVLLFTVFESIYRTTFSFATKARPVSLFSNRTK
jgi:hypothetical protein